MTITEKLDRFYNLFANATAPWEFFSGLGNYVSFILETRELKDVLDKELKKRDELCREIRELEDKSLIEMRDAKQKLLEVIKQKEINPSEFTQSLSAIPIPREKNHTIIDEMELFENGKISMSGFDSDHLENYLFDIAANILRLGYRDDVKDFIVSDDYYKDYFRRVNGDMEGFEIVSNKNGNFVFSETWPQRFQQVAALERERKLEPWGAFEALLVFWNGREAVLAGKNLDELTRNESELDFNGRLAVDTIYAARDFRVLANVSSPLNLDFLGSPQDARFLKVDNFKRHATMAHSYLLQHSADVGKSTPTIKSIRLITNSLEPTSTIWLVLNELFETPIRFAVKNRRGEPTAIKKLYDISYIADAPNKSVPYDKKVADGINNGLFKKREVARFLQTNHLVKPTLVKKSEDGALLVLKGDVPVYACLIKNSVPSQHQSIYIDKTR